MPRAGWVPSASFRIWALCAPRRLGSFREFSIDAVSTVFALGIMGSYVWRAYENTKGRPLAVVMREDRFGPGSPRAS